MRSARSAACADPVEGGLVSVVRAVREIQPEDIDARRMRASSASGESQDGSDRRDDPRVAHVGLSLQSDSAMRQIVPAPVGRYLEALHGPVDPLLETVRAEGLAAGLPLVEPDTARLLRSLAIAIGAKKILEIGTAIGYSALWMAQALPADGSSSRWRSTSRARPPRAPTSSAPAWRRRSASSSATRPGFFTRWRVRST